MELTDLKPNEIKIEGTEIEYDDNCSFILAYAGPDNPAYQANLFRVTKKYSGKGRLALSGKRQSETNTLIQTEVYADCIVRGWKGLTENGTELTYSREECLRVLRSYPSLMEWVQLQAMDLENFQDTMITEDEKSNL